jgi:peptidyl-prolyl cis-trans isomerase B (cyclophilin B)
MRNVSLLAFTALLAVFLFATAQAAPSTSHGAQGSGPLVLLDTTKGPILIKLYPKDAPITCANFLKLVKAKFYDGLMFHRVADLVAPGVAHIAQVGDPQSRTLPPGDPRLGTGGSGTTIKGEFPSNGVNNPLVHVPGAVAMARSQDPNSATSQFYICTSAAHELDGSYAVFGLVIKGLDNAANIVVGDKITKATVVRS